MRVPSKKNSFQIKEQKARRYELDESGRGERGGRKKEKEEEEGSMFVIVCIHHANWK